MPLVPLMVFCPQPQDVSLRGYTAGLRGDALGKQSRVGPRAAPQPSSHTQVSYGGGNSAGEQQKAGGEHPSWPG